MGFLFTEDNQNLQRLKNEWILGNSFGVYVLAGESGSGKTAFLKQLEVEWKNVIGNNQITWMTTEELIDIILKQEDPFKNVQTPVFVLDNMEEMIGKDNTIALFWSLLEGWIQEGQHLFIGVTNNSQIYIPHYVEVMQISKITITSSVVFHIANMQDVQLNKDRIDLLRDEAEGSVSRLIGLIKREKLLYLTH